MIIKYTQDKLKLEALDIYFKVLNAETTLDSKILKAFFEEELDTSIYELSFAIDKKEKELEEKELEEKENTDLD